MKEIIDTKITDKWGVTWDEMEVVRDFLQNFYDANPIDAIQITITDTTAEITAPEIFDYQQLIYLGSHKKEDESNIGQYGEGWKAALLNAMRNWNCDITFIVGNRQLHYFFEKATIGKGEMQILKCEVSELNTAFEGSKLIVKNCTKKLLSEFTFGLKYFYHEKNPLFASLLEKTYSNDSTNDIFIYKSSTSEGYVFYKKLMRSKIDVPLVIVCNRSYVNIDKEIAHDRDRKAFKKDVLDRLLKYIFKNFNNHYMKSILPEFQPFWEKGHWLLALIAETRAYNDWKVPFPDNYYAKGKEEKEDMELRLEMSKVQEEYDHLNYHSCPSYMSKFKMKSIRTVAEERIKKRKEVLNKAYTRGLTSYEKLSVNILSEFIKELSHDLYKNFENAKYTVGQNDEVIGELKQKRNYREQHIFLNKVFFTFSFSDALAVLLHEWAHIYGSDGSRTFSDALTYFIALILKNESIIQNLKQWEQKWTQSIQLIESESDRNSSKESLQSVKNSLTPTQMKIIIEKIPDEDFFLLYNQS